MIHAYVLDCLNNDPDSPVRIRSTALLTRIRKQLDVRRLAVSMDL